MHVASVRPGVEPYLPAGHGVQVAALVAPTVVENVPGGHGVHAVESVAPLVLEYVPAGQFAHAVAPGEEYFPEPHILDPDPAPVVEVLPY